jgi:hypothetical protein
VQVLTEAGNRTEAKGRLIQWFYVRDIDLLSTVLSTMSVTSGNSQLLAQRHWRGLDPLAHPDDLTADCKFRTHLLASVARAQKSLEKWIKSVGKTHGKTQRRQPQDPCFVFRDALSKALEDGRTYALTPLCDEVMHMHELHKHRRRIAGISQEFELWTLGERMYKLQQQGKLLILLGHRYVITSNAWTSTDLLKPHRINITEFNRRWDSSFNCVA